MRKALIPVCFNCQWSEPIDKELLCMLDGETVTESKKGCCFHSYHFEFKANFDMMNIESENGIEIG